MHIVIRGLLLDLDYWWHVLGKSLVADPPGIILAFRKSGLLARDLFLIALVSLTQAFGWVDALLLFLWWFSRFLIVLPLLQSLRTYIVDNHVQIVFRILIDSNLLLHFLVKLFCNLFPGWQFVRNIWRENITLEFSFIALFKLFNDLVVLQEDVFRVHVELGAEVRMADELVEFPDTLRSKDA